MEPLTWNELADIYDKNKGGRRARTLPMDKVFEWAESHKELFRMDDEGYLYKIMEEPND